VDVLVVVVLVEVTDVEVDTEVVDVVVGVVLVATDVEVKIVVRACTTSPPSPPVSWSVDRPDAKTVTKRKNTKNDRFDMIILRTSER